MDVLTCVAIAAAESWAVTRFGSFDVTMQAPGSSASESNSNNMKTFWVLLVVQYLSLKYYRIFLYHKYFSPLRHLPGPTVSLIPILQPGPGFELDAQAVDPRTHPSRTTTPS